MPRPPLSREIVGEAVTSILAFLGSRMALLDCDTSRNGKDNLLAIRAFKAASAAPKQLAFVKEPAAPPPHEDDLQGQERLDLTPIANNLAAAYVGQPAATRRHQEGDQQCSDTAGVNQSTTTTTSDAYNSDVRRWRTRLGRTVDAADAYGMYLK